MHVSTFCKVNIKLFKLKVEYQPLSICLPTLRFKKVLITCSLGPRVSQILPPEQLWKTVCPDLLDHHTNDDDFLKSESGSVRVGPILRFFLFIYEIWY